jgi:hypothetical protein
MPGTGLRHSSPALVSWNSRNSFVVGRSIPQWAIGLEVESVVLGRNAALSIKTSLVFNSTGHRIGSRVICSRTQCCIVNQNIISF